MSHPNATRRGRARLGVEVLECRTAPAVGISGQAFLANGAIAPPTAPPDPGVANVTVFLDANGNGQLDFGETTTQTDASGNYTFANLPAGTYAVGVKLPANTRGFSAQSLNYRVTPTDGTTFANLNFALTGESEALVRNIFERVLVRPPGLGGQTGLADRLDAGTLTTGQLFASVLSQDEFRGTVAPIARMLAAFFPGQPVEPNLFRANLQQMRAGLTQDAAVLNVLYAPAFMNVYGDTSKLNDAAFTRLVYNRLLGRDPTADEQSAWLLALSKGTYNRGQMVLRLLANPQGQQANPDAYARVVVSMAYLGILGRPADPRGFAIHLNYLLKGGTVAGLGDALAATREYQTSKGFADLFLSDVQAQQVKTAVNVLSRLQRFDPATGQFDQPVTAGSLNGLTKVGSAQAPANVYFIAHGWAPGYAQDVAINSTPGNPLKVWQTVEHPGGLDPIGPDSPWLFNGVDQVSAEGFARAVTNADPNAVVIAYSWIDESGTAGEGSISLTDPTPLLLGGQSEAYTQQNGLRLAQAVEQALSPTFFTNKGLIHLLGHSHGSKVATVAALALQQADVAVSQLTLFESPETGPKLLSALRHIPGLIGAQNFLWYYLQQMAISRQPVNGERVPLTNEGGTFQTFVDNYYSEIGFGEALGGFPSLGQVVDVLLHSEVLDPLPSPTDPNFAKDLAGALFDAHDYPPPWYAQASLQTLGTASANGVNWSPLLAANAAPAAGLYSQTWTSNVFNQQFALSQPTAPPALTPSFTPLNYATRYVAGRVAEGNGIFTLGAGGSDPLSLLAMSFTPIAATGNTGKFGTGLNFKVQFHNAGKGDQLVFWARGDVALDSPFPSAKSGELGYKTIPLFVMDGESAGAAAQGATVSMDLFANNPGAILEGAFGTTNSPVFGFSLLRAPGSTATVTVSELTQFTDGSS